MKRADEEPTPEAIDTAIFQDPLRRHGEVERFLQMLLAVEPPYTILVNAPWGSGKTFFIKQIERVLRMANPALEQDFYPSTSTPGKMTISTIRSCPYWQQSPYL